MTGVEVPKYYNPAAVNPLKYAEQVQKRKLLWSKKTDEKEKNVSSMDASILLFFFARLQLFDKNVYIKLIINHYPACFKSD